MKGMSAGVPQPEEPRECAGLKVNAFSTISEFSGKPAWPRATVSPLRRASATPERPPNVIARPRVLIVDDMPPNVLLLERHLEHDYDVTGAHDGATALKLAEELRPDLILLDVRMPGLSGYEVCETLKSRESTRFTPVILVTAHAHDRASKIHGLDCGADDFLVKPIDVLELSARVRNLIRVKVLTEQNRQLECERERASVLRDVVFAVTNGKLELVDDGMLSSLRTNARVLAELDVRTELDVFRARDATERVLLSEGWDADRVLDFVLCVSEAATNVVKHARGGLMQVCTIDSCAQAWIRDQGDGIDFTTLPRSALMKGWSSKVSLGCGFTIMLGMLDRLLLSTTPGGTTLVLEMKR